MKYKIISNNLFVRKENGSIYLVIEKEKGGQFVVNEMGKRITELILSNNNTEVIKSILLDEYGQEYELQIEHDVDDISKMLIIYNIISSDELSDNIGINKEIISLGDKEYIYAYKFIEKNFNNNYNVLETNDLKYYNPLNLRSRTMNNQEYAVLYCESNNIEAYCSYIPNFDTSVVIVNNIIFSDKYSFDEKCSVLNKMLEYVALISQRQINKFRINFISSEMTQNNKELFRDIGFYIEAELKNEIDMETVLMYAKDNNV